MCHYSKLYVIKQELPAPNSSVYLNNTLCLYIIKLSMYYIDICIISIQEISFHNLCLGIPELKIIIDNKTFEYAIVNFIN